MSIRFTHPSVRSWIATARAWFAILAIPVIAAAQQTVSPGPASAVGQNETVVEPLDFEGPGQKIVAPTRIAWCSALSPDETWLATCYGVYQGDVGRLRVWDLKTGNVKWEAREDRGIRRVAISPDGSLVASGNWEGEIHFRDAVTGDLRRSLANIGGSIECISFSSDGRSLVSCGNRRTLRIWDVATGQVLKTFEGHTNVAYGVHFSPDDKLLVSHGRDRSARIWNVEGGSLQHIFPHLGEVTSAIFLPDGRQVATACTDGQVRIFDVDSGKLVVALPPLSAEQAVVTAVAASRDGKLLATSEAMSIRIWNTGTWKAVATLDDQRSFTRGLVLSKDAKTLISSDSAASVRIWDVPTQTERRAFSLPSEIQVGAGQLRALAIAPDGKLLATASGGNQVELRDRTTGDIVRTLVADDTITAVAFSPNGKTLATAGGGLRLWDVQRGASLADSLGDANTLAWSPDGTLLATGSADNIVRLWNVATRKEVALLEGHKAEVLSVAFTPDGRRLISGSGDATAGVWDVGKQTLIKTLAGHAGVVRAVAVSPDGTTIVTAGDETSVRLWDATTLKPRAVLKGHQNAVASLAFSPQGRTLASGGMGGGVLLWDARRGVSRKTLNGHTESVTALGFLPDGSGLISGSADQTIRLWRAGATRVPALVSLPAHPPLAFAVEFSRDGNWLATGGRDNFVALRDPATGAVRRTLTGHRGLVYDVAFSPDSTCVASASADGTVKLWSVDPGMQLASYNAFGERFSNIRSVAYSPDGLEIASGSEDGTIKLWNVNDRKVRHTLMGQALPVLCVNYSPDGSLLATSTGFNQQTQVPGELRLWDAKSGKEIASLDGHTTEIKRAVFDADGRRLASVGSDGSVLIWNVADRAVETRFRADAAVTSIVFLADRNLLAIGDNRGGVAIYSITQGAAVRRFAGHEKLVPGIAVRPDQQILATASHDGTVKLWPVGIEK